MIFYFDRYKIQTQWIKTRGHQELYGRIMDLSPAVDISYNLPTQRSVQLEEFAGNFLLLLSLSLLFLIFFLSINDY